MGSHVVPLHGLQAACSPACFGADLWSQKHPQAVASSVFVLQALNIEVWWLGDP